MVCQLHDCGDWRYIREQVAQNSTNPEADLKRLIDQTFALVREHWATIERVACELVFKREIHTLELWKLLETK